jgi:hypothetical protein
MTCLPCLPALHGHEFLAETDYFGKTCIEARPDAEPIILVQAEALGKPPAQSHSNATQACKHDSLCHTTMLIESAVHTEATMHASTASLMPMQ